ncbi:MAG: hypothetical protein J6C46_02605 [Clostridia bacterium]|nr:hypothetical protein [Clostridia bacterium]
MTKSNKILLETLFKIEFELGKTQKIFENKKSCFYLQIDFSKIYDLFNVIILAFNIPESNYDFLYDLLNSLYNNEISVRTALYQINKLINN